MSAENIPGSGFIPSMTGKEGRMARWMDRHPYIFLNYVCVGECRSPWSPEVRVQSPEPGVSCGGELPSVGAGN